MPLASAFQKAREDDHNLVSNSSYSGSIAATPMKISSGIGTPFCSDDVEGISSNLQYDWNKFLSSSSAGPELTEVDNLSFNSFMIVDTANHDQRDLNGDQSHALKELAELLLGPEEADIGSSRDVYQTQNAYTTDLSVEASNESITFLDGSYCPALLDTKNLDTSNSFQNHRNSNCHEEEYIGRDHCPISSIQGKMHDVKNAVKGTESVKHLLIQCAKAIAKYHNSDNLFTELRGVVDIYGDPMQRLGAYMLEALVARVYHSGSHIYKSLKCKEPTGPELLSYMRTLYENIPYFKFGYTVANGAIAEAFKNKDRVHIIDFQIAQGNQWPSLIQALASRPGGAPHIRITGVDDGMSRYARGQGLQIVGQKLSAFAEKFHVLLEFKELPFFPADIYADMLEIRPGEALAVNFPMLLHHVPDESVCMENHRDRLLRMVKNLNPDVVTVIEQEANTNTLPFFPRFIETMEYYFAVFASLDASLPRESKERVNAEQHCLAGDLVNLIACEGGERVERHEPFQKWKCRFTMAGFKPYPLSSHVNSTIKFLLQSYNPNYMFLEKDKALYLGWLRKPLFVASAWR